MAIFHTNADKLPETLQTERIPFSLQKHNEAIAKNGTGDWLLRSQARSA